MKKVSYLISLVLLLVILSACAPGEKAIAGEAFKTATSSTGLCWEKQNVAPAGYETSANLYDVDFVDVNNGWIVGNYNSILRYNSGRWTKETISPVQSTNPNLFGVYAADASNVWVVGGVGSIHYFNGASWIREGPTKTDGTSNIVYQSDAIYTNLQNAQFQKVRGSGTSLVKAVGYATYTTVGTTTTSYVNIMAERDPSTGSWTVRPFTLYAPTIQTGLLRDIYFQDATTGWVLMVDTLFKTVDGGGTWVKEPSTVDPGESLSGFRKRIFFLDANTGWAPGLNRLSKSVNGGKDWVLQLSTATTPNTPSLSCAWGEDVYFTDAQRGWATFSKYSTCATVDTILETIDGGSRWQSVGLAPNSPTPAYMRGIDFADAATGYAIGDAVYVGGVFSSGIYKSVPCPDSDTDGVFDGSDNCRLFYNPVPQADSDNDCPPVGDGYATDPLCGNGCDPDSDNDGVCDPGRTAATCTGSDSAPTDRLICQDSDGDTCDDCSAGTGANPATDGTDTDGDGLCNSGTTGGDPDDDNDGVVDGSDSAPLIQTECSDTDRDLCNDCSQIGTPGGPTQVDPANDGPNFDKTLAGGDDLCDAGDADDDADGDPDSSDCNDADSVINSGATEICTDNVDNDCDGQTDINDVSTSTSTGCEGHDSDSDGVPDVSDTEDTNINVCGVDSDADTCDDCSAGTGANPATDGLDADSDGRCDAGDPDDDNDGVADGSDSAPLVQTECSDTDRDLCNDCSQIGTPGGPTQVDPANDGPNFDKTLVGGDDLCDAGDLDDDADGVNDYGADNNLLTTDDNDCAPLDPTIHPGVEESACRDAVDNDCDLQTDYADADCSSDDFDGDGVNNGADRAPTVATACADSDNDGCDDCTFGTNAPHNDGPDTDAVLSNPDGLCDAGDPDDDNDGVCDPGQTAAATCTGSDSAPTNNLLCQDSDGDTCDDCSQIGTAGGPTSVDATNDGPNFDKTLVGGDNLCDASDDDDDADGDLDSSDCNDADPAINSGATEVCTDAVDNDCDGETDLNDVSTSTSTGCEGHDSDSDGVPDVSDTKDNNVNVCGVDSDNDLCDDCSAGTGANTATDGTDPDGDGLCDAGDGDDDDDGVDDTADSADNDPFLCADSDGDTCDDCSIAGNTQPNNDGVDSNSDGQCDDDPLETDDDGDGSEDTLDCAPTDGAVHSGATEVCRDGMDNNCDGDIDATDATCVNDDPDNDGVVNQYDSDDTDPGVCQDADGDTCDDCAIGSDGDGLLADNNPSADGSDSDGDGQCDASDSDDDDDGVIDSGDSNPVLATECGDIDGDGCEDCSSGRSDVSNDGDDFDEDGLCNAGDVDDDGDTVNDNGADGIRDDNPATTDVNEAADNDCAPLDSSIHPGVETSCRDSVDNDCDLILDESDTDCAGDDPDNDGVVNQYDAADVDATVCQDSDGDTCDDCSVASTSQVNNDGTDTDSDGQCNAGDGDDDGDGVADGSDLSSGADTSLNPNLCGDSDSDTCDDCSKIGTVNGPATVDVAKDGTDLDLDGLCDAGDLDNDDDGFNECGVDGVCADDSATVDVNEAADNDNCPLVKNDLQTDTDRNSLGDACNEAEDADGDEYADALDNCPAFANADQVDFDHDLLGDLCDDNDDGDAIKDCGEDTVCADDLATDVNEAADNDNCALTPNPLQEDADADLIGDVCDPDKEGDGILDAADNCPLVANAGQEDADGDNFGDLCDDSDNDGVVDATDLCPAVRGDQADLDQDGVGNACDTCIAVANPDQLYPVDTDGDTVGDACAGADAAGDVCEPACTEVQQCIGGRCVTCVGSEDCPAEASYCVNYACVACLADTDCAANQVCIGNVCYQELGQVCGETPCMPGVGCNRDNLCGGLGASCSQATQCFALDCLEGECGEPVAVVQEEITPAIEEFERFRSTPPADEQERGERLHDQAKLIADLSDTLQRYFKKFK